MQSVFVSSTFRDMNFERDILNREISPKLNHALTKFNRSVRISDLRWGIDTSDLSEEAATERVLSVCFEEIENCQPYIIILLGDRYGYVPDTYNKSVTHMEIIKGALEKANREKVFVYLRKADYSGMPEDLKKTFIEQNPKATEQLQVLKTELKSLLPKRCREYTSHWSAEEQLMISDSFEKTVYEDLLNAFEAEYADLEYRSSLEKYLREGEELLAENLLYAYKSEDKVSADIDKILQTTDPYGFVDGSGAGKSVYMSLLCSELRKKGKKAQIIFCGDNAFNARVRNVAETVLYSIVTACGEEYEFEKNSDLTCEQLLELILKKRDGLKEKIYIMLDAIDKSEERLIDLILWLRIYAADLVGVVFSSRATEQLAEKEAMLQISSLSYSKADIRNMMLCLLKRERKELPEKLVDAVVSNVNNPIELRLTLFYLTSLNNDDFQKIYSSGGQIDSINSYLKSTIKELDGIENIIRKIIQRLLPNNETAKFFISIISWISFSEYGLYENDLEKLIELNNVKWVQIHFVDFLIKFSSFIRIAENGRIDISHDIIRVALRNIFSYSADDITISLAEYYLKKQELTTFDVRNFFGAVYKAKYPYLLTQFILKKYNLSENSINTEIKKSFWHLFLKDHGVFIACCACQCENFENIKRFFHFLPSLFFKNKDMCSENKALQTAVFLNNLCAYFNLPQYICDDIFKDSVHFLEKHKINENLINKFKSEHHIQIVEAPQENQNGNITVFEDLTDTLLSPDTDVSSCVDYFEAFVNLSRYLLSAKKDIDRVLNCLHRLKAKSHEIFSEDIHYIVDSHINAFIGEAYKIKKNWSESFKYDKMNVDLFENLLEESPNEFNIAQHSKYKQNLANVSEAAILYSDDNSIAEEYIESIRDAYYNRAVFLFNNGYEEAYLSCADSSLTFGTTLVKAGKMQIGFRCFNEMLLLAQTCSKNLTKSEPTLHMCLLIFETLYRLIRFNQFDTAYLFTEKAEIYLPEILDFYTDEYKGRFLDILNQYLTALHKILKSYQSKEDYDTCLILLDITSKIYRCILPIMDNKLNIISALNEKGNIYFTAKKDYNKASEVYQQLIDEAYNNRWLSEEQNGEYNDNLTSRLCKAYENLLICLNRIGDKEKLSNCLNQAVKYVPYFSEQHKSFKDDYAALMYSIAMHLAEENKYIALALLFSAQAFMSDENEKYKNEYKNTKIGILLAIAKLSKKDETENIE